MPNLVKNLKTSCKDVFKDKVLLTLLVIIAVVAVNQIVFSYLLVDREKASALTSSFGSIMFTTLTGGDIAAGTTDVKIAEFLIPDGLMNDDLDAAGGCGYKLAGNPCLTFIDSDGSATTAAGTVDYEGADYYFQFDPNDNIYNTIFQASDGVCTNSLSAPTCVYVDDGDDCDATDGDNHWYLLGTSCGTSSDINVATSLGTTTPWIHSDLVSNDAAYTTYGMYINTDDDLCNAADAGNGSFDFDLEPIWMEIGTDNDYYDPGTDLIIWDPANCLTTGPCASGCAGSVGGSSADYIVEIYVYDNSPTCKAAWQDQDSDDGLFTLGTDLIMLQDPFGCLSGGEVGTSITSNPEQFTETILMTHAVEDTQLRTGDCSHCANQWQSDPAGTWIGLGNYNGEGFIDVHPAYPGDGKLQSLDAGTPEEVVIIDINNNSLYDEAGDELIDADGMSGVLAGPNDDVIPTGATLQPITAAEGVCLNSLGYYSQYGAFAHDIIVYVDGNANCVPGDGGTDNLIRTDIFGLDMPTLVTNYNAANGTYPYGFFNAAGYLLYYDANSNLSWDYCNPNTNPGCGSPETESLWLEIQGAEKWHPAIEGTLSYSLLDADGTANSGTTIGTDDDSLSRGDGLTYLNINDNVCLGQPATGSLGLGVFEDIYIDGDSDCVPGSGGTDQIIYDATADGLNTSTVLGSKWFSGQFSFVFHDANSNSLYDVGADAANTESLWLELWNEQTYTSAEDTLVYPVTVGVFYYAGDTLTDLSTATGSSSDCGGSGCPLIYSDNDGSGTLTLTDHLWEDNGNIQSGPAGVPNSVIDIQATELQNLAFENLGTATSSDMTNVRFYLDVWWLGGDGICSTADIGPEIISYNNNIFSFSPDLNSQIPIYVKTCLYVDIPTSARTGRTIKPSLPQLYDANANGLYDPGDKGVFFYSSYDSPADGPIDVPYSFTITGGLAYTEGGGAGTPLDTTPPAAPSNVELKADASGTVDISWQDPADSDLASVIIQRDHNPIVGTVIDEIYQLVDKGVQLFQDIGLKIGQTYLYRLKAQDTAGNESIATETYSITIPEEGEVVIEPEEVLPSPEIPEVILPAGVEVGDLIKGVSNPAVYLVSSYGQRRPFPTLAIYNSWFADFSTVKVVSDQVLSQIPIGSNMILRPGTWLMKITTDPKVYAVEEGAIIRWLETEQIARTLYGSAWNKRVIDMPDTYFSDYQPGPSIADAVYSTGSLISYQYSADIYYVENSTKRLVSEAAFSQNHFQNKFVLDNLNPAAFVYETADPFPVDYDYTMTMTNKNKQKIQINPFAPGFNFSFFGR